MPQRFLIALALTSGLAAPLAAQVQMESVRLGSVYDGTSKALRSLVGIPGAAYVGMPLRAGVDQAISSPDGQWHIVRSAEVLALVADIDANNPGLPLPASRQAAWGPDSKSFVLVTPGTDLEPARFQRFELSAQSEWRALPVLEAKTGTLRILAFDSARGAIWWATDEVKEADGSISKATLWRLDVSSGSVERIIELSTIKAFALPVPGSEIHALGGPDGRILLLEHAADGWGYRDLEQTPLQNMRLSALRLLEGDRLLAIWNPETVSASSPSAPPKLLRYSLVTGISAETNLEFPSDCISPLRGKAFFLLQSSLRPEMPLLIFDASNENVFFVPDLRASVSGGGN
jgi:hypothetical protein